MSPNGRRAWRRWAKKRLDIVDGFVSSAWLDVQYWNKWRRHRKSLNPHRTIGLLPPKPFTARSLVGMTMGARKRKARYWMECERLHQKAQDLQEVVDRSVGRKSSLRTIGHTPISLRNHYRIGERLRPCPGCCACCLHPNGLNNLISWCDGSGVMPARKS